MKKQQSALLLIVLVLLVLIFVVTNNIKKQYSAEIETKIFDSIEKEMLNNFDKEFYSAFYKTYQISSKIIDQLDIKNKLLDDKLDIEYINSKDRYLRIYNNQKKLIYINEKDDVYKYDSIHFQYYIADPSCSLDFDISSFGVTISNIVPIIYGNSILATMQLQIQFDEVLKNLSKFDIEPILLLDEDYSKKINLSYSYSHKFLKNRYIVNQKANNYYIKLLEQTDMIENHKNKLYDKKSNVIIVRTSLYSKVFDDFIDVYLLKSTDNIKYDEINEFNNFINYIMGLLSFIVLLLGYIASSHIRNRYFALENEKLFQENKELKLLADKLDYNEKKLANLFNLQPNIMFISNGVEIVQVNKRFMGFFRRYGTFENFKKNHKDIAELFEPYDKPHYISTQLIDGKEWLEYILENPKQLYKTVMSIDNEPHHFIIKVNEMEYVKNFQERYIVVAFVDITQDVKNREKISVSDRCDIDEFDISYLIEDNISYAIHELTGLLPSKQAIFKATKDDIENVQLVSQHAILYAKDDIKLNWDILISVKNISYIYNIIISNFDANIEDELNDDFKDMAKTIVDYIFENLTDNILKQSPNKLEDISYSLLEDIDLVDGDIDTKNIYKFTMFLESEELSIFINFDKESFKYIKQIQMLGMFFG